MPWGPPPVGRTVWRRRVRELLATMGWRRRPAGCQPVFWRVFLALLSCGVQGKVVGRRWEEMEEVEMKEVVKQSTNLKQQTHSH